MLLSGFAGISYEILYGRILGNMVGDQFAVSAAILMTFLLGIGFGSLYAHRLWRWLWAIEAGIGVFALLVALSAPWIEDFVYVGASLFTDSLLGSIAVCVVILVVPAFLIGCSVPLFSGYFNRLNEGEKNSFSWVYMGYNFGAALTAILIEFYFIRGLGIQGAVILFAVVNMVIACLLKYSFSNVAWLHEKRVHQHWRDMIQGVSPRILLSLAIASIGSAVFQLFMVKYSELVFGPFRESFAIVLALVLFGISLGSLIVARLKISFSTLMWINLGSIVWLMLMAGPAIYIYAAFYPFAGDSFWLVMALKSFILTALMLLPAITFGATIPALLSHQSEVSHESGFLLFVSSLANVFGFLLMVFGLHRYLDFGVQLLVVGAIVGISTLTYYQWRVRKIVLVGLVLSLLGGVYWKQWDEDLLYLSYTNFKSSDDLVGARKDIEFPDRYKGYQDIFSINWMDGTPFFFINGYISIPLNNPSEKIVGAASSLFSPRLDNALVLGLGSGATASTVGLFFDKTDVVEINPVVRENLFRMKQWNFDIENNPRVEITVDDAIHYVKTRTKKYSLILNTVTTPLYFSSAKLYTEDFFKHVKNRLTDDGVYVTWVDSRVGDKGVDIILRTLNSNFKHAAALYVKSAYFLLIASNKPLAMTQQRAVVDNVELRKNLMQKHGIMSAWIPYQLMTTDAFSLIGEPEGDINTANDPVLEFEMAHLQETGIPLFKRKLMAGFNIQEIENALAFTPKEFPADFIKHTESRLKGSVLYRAWKKELAKTDDAENTKELAELYFRKIRMQEMKTTVDRHAYAYQLIVLNRYAEAIEVLNQLLVMDPKYDNAYYNLGVCFEALGQFNKAIASFKKELEIDAKDLDAEYRIGRLLVELGEYFDGLDVLTRYINKDKDVRSKAFFYRALAHKALGHEALSNIDLSLALRLKKQDEELGRKVGMFK